MLYNKELKALMKKAKKQSEIKLKIKNYKQPATEDTLAEVFREVLENRYGTKQS